MLKKLYELISKSNYKLAIKINDFVVNIKCNYFFRWIKFKKIRNTFKRDNYIYIDVTESTEHFGGAGTFRVVKNISQNILFRKDIVFVRNFLGKIITNKKFVNKIINNVKFCAEENVELLNTNKILILDVIPQYAIQYKKILEHANKKGVKTYSFLHDLFAIEYPEWFGSRHFSDIFKEYVDIILENSACIICNSKTTAYNVANYYKKQGIIRHRPLEVFFIHMGVTQSRCKIAYNLLNRDIVEFVKKGYTFLMVGTIEPRKNYEYVIKNFKKLNNEKIKYQLLIIGRRGWHCEKITKAIENAEISGVYWVDNASDDELYWSYNNCEALIAASKDEGFGLPLIEAAMHNMPLICNDIPVFREVAGDSAMYFDVNREYSLLDLLNRLDNNVLLKKPDIKLYNWEESSKELLRILDDQAEPLYVLN